MHPALGIDHGDVRIGIAATDEFGLLAFPVETIDQTRCDPVERIAELAAARRTRTLVLGLPLRMDSREGTAAAKVQAFAKTVRRRLPDLPLVFVDETLTTTEATAKLREAGRKTRNHRSVIDQAAAVEILNLWMAEAFNEIHLSEDPEVSGDLGKETRLPSTTRSGGKRKPRA